MKYELRIKSFFETGLNLKNEDCLHDDGVNVDTCIIYASIGVQGLNNNSADVGLVSLYLALVRLTSTEVSEAVNWIPSIQFVCHPYTQHHVFISRTVPTLNYPSLRSSHIRRASQCIEKYFPLWGADLRLSESRSVSVIYEMDHMASPALTRSWENGVTDGW